MGGKMAKSSRYRDDLDYHPCSRDNSVISHNYNNDYRSMFDDYPKRDSTTSNGSFRSEAQKFIFKKNTYLPEGLHPHRSSMPNTNPCPPHAFSSPYDSAVHCNQKRPSRF